MSNKDDLNLTPDDVWNEHLANVHVGRHWAYMAAVLGGGLLLMLLLMALLGGGR